MIRVDQQKPATKEPQTPCLALRARDAAKAVGVSERTLATWVNQGLVPHIRLGGVVLFPVRSLEKWLEQKVQTREIGSGDPKKDIKNT